MELFGLQKLSLLDFPEKTACTVFLGGCNFRCPFCQNGSLVLPGAGEPQIDEEEFFAFLKKRAGILDGVCITGGEPTLHKDLPVFAEKIRALGFAVKLDTNGSRPTCFARWSKRGLSITRRWTSKTRARNTLRPAGWISWTSAKSNKAPHS